MPYKKAMKTEEIKTTIHGKEYIGKRIIEGQKTMTQTIYYGGLSEKDTTTYLLGKNSSDMFHVAKIILAELVFKTDQNK